MNTIVGGILPPSIPLWGITKFVIPFAQKKIAQDVQGRSVQEMRQRDPWCCSLYLCHVCLCNVQAAREVIASEVLERSSYSAACIGVGVKHRFDH